MDILFSWLVICFSAWSAAHIVFAPRGHERCMRDQRLARPGTRDLV